MQPTVNFSMVEIGKVPMFEALGKIRKKLRKIWDHSQGFANPLKFTHLKYYMGNPTKFSRSLPRNKNY